MLPRLSRDGGAEAIVAALDDGGACAVEGYLDAGTVASMRAELEFVAGWLRPQENHVGGVDPAVGATLPARLQDLLGYDVYLPFLVYVDGRHPRRVAGFAP